MRFLISHKFVPSVIFAAGALTLSAFALAQQANQVDIQATAQSVNNTQFTVSISTYVLYGNSPFPAEPTNPNAGSSAMIQTNYGQPLAYCQSSPTFGWGGNTLTNTATCNFTANGEFQLVVSFSGVYDSSGSYWAAMSRTFNLVRASSGGAQVF